MCTWMGQYPQQHPPHSLCLNLQCEDGAAALDEGCPVGRHSRPATLLVPVPAHAACAAGAQPGVSRELGPVPGGRGGALVRGELLTWLRLQARRW